MRGVPGGRVLRVGIVAEESRGRAIGEVLLAGLQGSVSGIPTGDIGPQDLRVEVFPRVRLLREAPHGGAANVIVVDPAHVIRDEELVVGLAECVAAIGVLGTRIVLYADASPASLQGLHALMLRRIECSLVVEGVDETHLAREVAAAAVVGPAVWSLLQQLHEGLDRLPVAIQAAWRGAVVGDASINVKVIAYRARVSGGLSSAGTSAWRFPHRGSCFTLSRCRVRACCRQEMAWETALRRSVTSGRCD